MNYYLSTVDHLQISANFLTQFHGSLNSLINFQKAAQKLFLRKTVIH